MLRGERALPEEELARPATVLAKRFIQRWDLYARQLEDGRYMCVHEPLTMALLFTHLRGELTLGAYMLNRASQARFVTLDADARNGWISLFALATELAAENIPAYLEKSRRGGHLWLFFSRHVPGADARRFAQGIIAAHHACNVEVFPKQDTIGDGQGSLIRLPFGIHQITGRRYGFYASDGNPLGPTTREQIHALQSPGFVPEDSIQAYASVSSSFSRESPPERVHATKGPLSERIKAQVTVLEFVSQYVDLKPTENGAVGLCPFHDDQHPSFGVNDRENFWHCFAGCGGGSVIDFWARWRKKKGLDPDFVATITELAEMLF